VQELESHRCRSIQTIFSKKGDNRDPELVRKFVDAYTQSGQVMGTLAYMSPEQARGERLDARTDRFSFGAVYMKMATSQTAFPKAWDWTPPPATGIDPSLYKVILKLIQADREQRYGSASEVLEDLKRLDQRFRSSRDRRRHRLLLASALAVAVAIAVLAIGGAVWLRSPAALSRGQWVQLTKLPDSVSQPALSPDGRMLAFIREALHLFGCDLVTCLFDLGVLSCFPHPIRSFVRPFPPMGPVAATSSVTLRFPIFAGTMGS
jgi:serine/threonine protein kinase